MVIKKLGNIIFGKAERDSKHERSVSSALMQWKDAVRYFESVNDPDLIDFAIYDMEAARRKYVFLLKNNAAGKGTGFMT